jgi:hypothetical protein
MAGAELERTEDHIDEENEVDLTPRQISALDKLTKLGAEPRQSPDDKYDSDPQIRALQMVFEGRIGGPGRGQGRKSEKERVNRVLAERFRRKVAKLEKVIDEALDDDNIKVAMDAVRLVSDLDAKDAKQSLQEEQFEHDADNMDKEQLILALFQQLENPQVEAALRAQGEVINLPDSAVREVPSGDEAIGDAVVVQDDADTAKRGARDPEAPARPRVVRRAAPRDVAGRSPRDPARGDNPWKAAARRRAAN